MKTFTITLAWGDEEEGLYHWAGKARDVSAAERKARMEMDESYNDCYAKNKDGTYDTYMLRGKRAHKRTTEYRVVDLIEGVNEFAADDLLKALRACRNYIADDLTDSNREEDADAFALLDKADAAIKRGEGQV